VGKITILLSSFERGGITRTFTELFNELSRSTEVSFICFENRTPLSEKGIKVNVLGVGKVKNIFYKLPIAIKRYLALKTYLSLNQSSVLICADPSTTLLGWIYSLSHTSMRIIGGCHVPKNLMTLQDKLILKYLYPHLKSIVVPSETLNRELTDLSSKIKADVIPNMVPIDSCQNPWPKIGAVRENHLYFGRFSPEKNPKQFLRMANHDPSTRYLFCGEGEELPDLIRYCREESIHNVKFDVYQAASDVMPKANLLIIPSRNESFGISALEAWVQGVPVLASSEATGVLELMNMLSIVDAHRSLTDGIHLWVSRAQQMSLEPLDANISRNVLENFHPSVVISQWRELLAPRNV
jgi:glycosyltransferase involved in cell wall biosynthesis